MTLAYRDVCACPALMQVGSRTQVLIPTQQVFRSKEPSQLYKCVVLWVMIVCAYLFVGMCT